MLIYNLNGHFVDANEAKLACNDSAVLFGDSLFETLKAQDGQLQFLDEHLDRLELAARLLHFPCNRPTLRSALLETAKRLAAPMARLRLTLSRGPMTSLALPSPDSGLFFISASPIRNRSLPNDNKAWSASSPQTDGSTPLPSTAIETGQLRGLSLRRRLRTPQGSTGSFIPNG